MIEKPELIIFDFDNTLVDVNGILLQSIRDTIKHLGIDYSLDDNFIFHQSGKELFTKIFAGNINEARSKYLEFYQKNSLGLIKLYEYSIEILEFLTQKSIFLVLISNKHQSILDIEVKSLGLNKYFKAVIGSSKSKNDKPHIDSFIFLQNLLNLEIDPKKIWMIGDSETDHLFAGNIGCKSIIVGNQPIRGDLNFSNLKLLFKELNEKW